MKLVAFVILVMVVAWTAGCPPTFSPMPPEKLVHNSIPAVATNTDKGAAFVGSVASAIDAAKPHADPTGKSLLDLASGYAKSALTFLGLSKVDLEKVQQERDRIAEIAGQDRTAAAKKIADLAAQVAALTHSWGHRAQVLWEWIWKWTLTILIIHWATGFLSKFLWAPWDKILAGISYWTNILGALGWIVSKLHFHDPLAAVEAKLVYP